eukprot:CAMPEP_0194339668 /NCGR_PEP_ID=MMETSP0171-20130528/83945_1 /TAXON_ID=218684 /ORGANISM="Corethron pennatum, Strain L29A3" /LENGTH=41 /DNA_ID= /DNA_START= /DNA_END= /DNA_ORIENTATION=
MSQRVDGGSDRQHDGARRQAQNGTMRQPRRVFLERRCRSRA